METLGCRLVLTHVPTEVQSSGLVGLCLCTFFICGARLCKPEEFAKALGKPQDDKEVQVYGVSIGYELRPGMAASWRVGYVCVCVRGVVYVVAPSHPPSGASSTERSIAAAPDGAADQEGAELGADVGHSKLIKEDMVIEPGGLERCRLPRDAH